MSILPELRSSGATERWEPFRDLEVISERMRRFLEETFAGLPEFPPRGDISWSPLVDLEETDDAYLIQADLPGVKREDVEAELVGNELVIKGELKERERTGTLRRRTRRSGRFEYRLSLPDRLDADKIEAKLEDGVLEVRVPKSEAAQRRRIEIKA